MQLYQGSTAVSSPLCKPWDTEVNPYQSIYMITLCFVTGLIPLDCIAAFSLPMRPQLCLSPFWSPYLLSGARNANVITSRSMYGGKGLLEWLVSIEIGHQVASVD